jgi:hypothetical protein
MMLAVRDNSMVDIKGQVAQILLEHAGDSTNRHNQLSHRDMATMLNTGWDKIHLSLKSLHEEGAIKIDRNRIIIEKKTLQKLAGLAA